MTSPSLVDVRLSSKIFSLRLTCSNITSFLVNLIKFDYFLIIMDLQSTTVQNLSWLQYTTMELLLFLSTFLTSRRWKWLRRVLHYWLKKTQVTWCCCRKNVWLLWFSVYSENYPCNNFSPTNYCQYLSNQYN